MNMEYYDSYIDDSYGEYIEPVNRLLAASKPEKKAV
jgi:hypothetical protein